MICFKYADALITARARPAEYLEELLNASDRRCPDLCMSEEAYQKLSLKYFPATRLHLAMMQKPQPLTFGEAISEFILELKAWKESGFPLAPKVMRRARQSICNNCEEWRPRAYGLLGACNLCHCTAAKPYLLTSKCPRNKWPVIKR